jgi:hypothetical protein
VQRAVVMSTSFIKQVSGEGAKVAVEPQITQRGDPGSADYADGIDEYGEPLLDPQMTQMTQIHVVLRFEAQRCFRPLTYRKNPLYSRNSCKL